MKKRRLKRHRVRAPKGKKFIKKQEKAQEQVVFPSISRYIPDERRGIIGFFMRAFLSIDGFLIKHKIGLLVRNVLISCICLVLFALIVFVALDTQKTMANKQQVEEERRVLVQQKMYWEDIVMQHPDYRDGYMQLAILSYQLGNMVDAKMYVDKALFLDPNFEKGRELERKLRKE